MSLERDPNAIPPSDLHAPDPSLTAQPLVYFRGLIEQTVVRAEESAVHGAATTLTAMDIRIQELR
jgi:hypothetical protein